MSEFLRRLWELTRPYRFRLGLGVGCGVLAGFTDAALIASVQIVFKVLFAPAGAPTLADRVRGAWPWLGSLVQQFEAWLPQGIDPRNTPLIILTISLIPLVMLLRGLFSYLNNYFLQWAAIRAITDLRARLFNHLLNLSDDFFHRSSTGDLMSRIMNDTISLHLTISNSLATAITAPVRVVTLAAYLFAQNFQFTLLALLVLPVCLVPIVIYARKVRKSSTAIQNNYADLSDLMHESFTGNRIIKAYNLEPTVIAQFNAGVRKFIGDYMRFVRSSEIPGPLIEFAGALGVALIFFFSTTNRQMPMGPGDFLAYVGAIFMMYQPIKALTRLHNQLEQSRAASLRVFELLAVASSIAEPANPVPLRAAGAEIHFEKIDFSYGDKAVLHGVELIVKPGQLVALVGGSGAGKTTLTNLLLRFYDPQRGVVRIGGTDLRDVALRDLRSQIAVVTQETILFNDTIRRNIELGRPGATPAEVEEAARHAHAHEFILQKPLGYDTVIGERGANLSGGQRQRLAIARAILKDAPILVLDEATSALDSESERAVQEALEELMHGRTTICIAHWLSTIQQADLIVVLEHGRIVETGTHAELLAHGGVYQKLHALQFQN
ncbi:MAG: ABC transporter ATP-binding protein [Verrucomicrobia bacterium]|nr:ABC transporter ATP-binding protein [Verrucomicrobiota bacterium]